MEQANKMNCDVGQPSDLEEDGISTTPPKKRHAPSLDQLRATVEYDRSIHALISLYDDLLKRVEAIEVRVASL